MILTFVEMPRFSKQVADFLEDEEYGIFQNELMENPKRGDLIQGCNGIRKARIALSGRGKSGGGRVMYLYLPDRSLVLLFYLFRKSDAANLTKEQRNALGRLAQEIKDTFKNEKKRSSRF